MEPKKPSAASRTVDLFTGQTEQEVAVAAAEELQAEHRQLAEPLEVSCNQKRDTAFATQEYISKTWGHPPEELGNKEVFRITQRGEWSFLEQLRMGTSGVAYHWTGFMYRTSNQHELTNVCVKASKAMVGKDV